MSQAQWKMLELLNSEALDSHEPRYRQKLAAQIAATRICHRRLAN
ncbi:hypothetical protein ACFW2D_16235 [Streptomyces sp. NPDC058914]